MTPGLWTNRIVLVAAFKGYSEHAPGAHRPEPPSLALDVCLAPSALGGVSRSNVDDVVHWTVGWHRAAASGGDLRVLADAQIDEFEELDR